ncbi:hypothetical protein KSF78_0005583 [Schistosoma japonicum]|nr:hypothetical protein KSF78_0005583 [Schistosoma japonicum]
MSLKSLADRDSNSIDVWRCPSCDHFHSDTNNHICGSVFTLAHLCYASTVGITCLLIILLMSTKSLVDRDSNSIGVRRCPFCDHLNSDTINHICGSVYTLAHLCYASVLLAICCLTTPAIFL